MPGTIGVGLVLLAWFRNWKGSALLKVLAQLWWRADVFLSCACAWAQGPLLDCRTDSGAEPGRFTMASKLLGVCWARWWLGAVLYSSHTLVSQSNSAGAEYTPGEMTSDGRFGIGRQIVPAASLHSLHLHVK